MELKYGYVGGHVGKLLVLIVPLWNWNERANEAADLVYKF